MPGPEARIWDVRFIEMANAGFAFKRAQKSARYECVFVPGAAQWMHGKSKDAGSAETYE
jgi:hypothetical protein